MVEQHPNGDVPVSRVLHRKFRQVPYHGVAQIQPVFIRQDKDRGGGEHFARRPDVEPGFPVDRNTFRPVRGAEALRKNYLPAVQNCHSTAIGASGGHCFPQKISGRPDCRIIRSCRRKRNKKQENSNCSCHEPTCTSHLPVPPLIVNTNSFETYCCHLYLHSIRNIPPIFAWNKPDRKPEEPLD